MKYVWFLALVVVLFPTYASAASFAKQSLFLSKTPVTEGETVLIHAVVSNDAATSFSGDVVFKEADQKIGSVAVTIAPGGANAVSVSWKPAAGSHNVTAQLTAQDGSVVEAESATFTVNPKPVPASAPGSDPTLQAAIESSQNIQNKIGQYSPAAASTTAPMFSGIDSLRAKAADALDQGITWAKDKTGGKNPGQVLGASTSNTSSSGIIGTLWNILALIVLYTFTILRFLVGSAGIFYPVFAILFFFVLWKTFKRFRRPSYG